MAKNTVVSHLSLDLPKTRIMATIGPSNYKIEQLRGMLENGATIFRFNAAKIKKEGIFDPKYIKAKNIKVSSILEKIKLLSEERRQPITTSLDLAGPKVRMQQIISIHKREKETERELENQPEEGDMVYLYSKNVSWSDNHIKETLGSIDPSTIQSIDSDPKKVKEAKNDPACVDNIWRLQTDIESFETVDKYISIRDGMCNLRILQYSPKNDFVKTKVKEVANDFIFVLSQGVNPKGYVFPHILDEKDLKDFTWALDKRKFDLVCVSFVCSPLEYFKLKKEIADLKKDGEKNNWEPLIFAKIETIFAVDPKASKKFCRLNKLDRKEFYGDRILKEDYERYEGLIKLYKKNPIKAICETFDGVMVARGDLAVEANKYCVPFYQKSIVDACRLANKSVIIATEVLLSMDDGNPSTRAEIGDIATAVLDGADVIMLAKEVASSEKSDPVKVVQELRKAIQTAEKEEEKEKGQQSTDDIRYFYEKFSRLLHKGESHLQKIKELKLLSSEEFESARWKIGMGSRVCLAARSKYASAILVSVTTGKTAKYVSYFQPAQHIISIGNSMEVARRILLWKGIYPVVMQYPSKYELNDFILIARELHSDIHIKPSEKWKDEKNFVIPGLLRIKSKLQDENEKKLLPSTVHEISLPNLLLDKSSKGVPEREKKYILKKEDYIKLKEELERCYSKNVKIKQRNYYFYDPSDVIKDKKAMVRIRIEEIDQKPERAFLTFKKEGKKVGGGTEERPEKEFNVTRYLLANGLLSNSNGFFNKLPDFFKELLWEEFKKDFKGKGITAPDRIQLKNIAMMSNTRLTVETKSELTLELDSFTTKENLNYYELEIETIAADENKRDEYVSLLFKYLGIEEAYDPDYPQKFVRTLLDFGIMKMTEKYRNAIARVYSKLGINSGS